MGGDGGGEAPRGPAPAMEPGSTRPPGFRSAPRSGALGRSGPLPTAVPSSVRLYQSGDRRVSDQVPCGDRDRTCFAGRERGQASVLPLITD